MRKSQDLSLTRCEKIPHTGEYSSVFDTILQGLKLLTSDYSTNLAILTKLAGEFLGADCVCYNRLAGDSLQNVCCWNAPEGFVFPLDPHHTICYDMLTNKPEEYCYVPQLNDSEYADKTGLGSKYKFKTYVGQKVQYADKYQSIVCAFFKKDVLLAFEERKFLEFVALLIGLEESRALMSESYLASQSNYKQLYFLLRLICDNEPDMIWAKDVEGKYLFANKAMCDKLLEAVDTQEPIGKNDLYFTERARKHHLNDPTWSNNADLCNDTDAKTLKANLPQRFEEFYYVSGEVLQLDVHKAPLLNLEGQTIGTVGSARDITQAKAVEVALRESEARYKALLEANPDIMFVFNSRGDILACKSPDDSLLLKKPEEMIGSNLSDHISKHLCDLAYYAIKQVKQTGKPYTFEYDLNVGQAEHFESRFVQYEEDLFLNIVRDITEKKRSERIVRDSEAMFRRVVETSNEGIWMLDNNCFTTYVNMKMLDILACDESDMLGFSMEKWIPEKDLPAHRIKMAERARGQKDNYELKLKNKAGLVVWALVSATAIINDAEEYVGSFGMFTDITARKKTECALQESEERYRTFLDNAPISIAVHSGGILEYVNPAAVSLVHATAANQLLGKPVTEFIHPDYIKLANANLSSIVRGKQQNSPVEYMFKRLDGEYIPADVYASVLKFQDKKAVQIIISDTSERKKAETLVLRNETRLKSMVNILQHRTGTWGEFLAFALSEIIILSESSNGYIFFYSEDKQEAEAFSWTREQDTQKKNPRQKKSYHLDDTGIWGEAIHNRKPFINNAVHVPKIPQKGMPKIHPQLKKLMAIPVFCDGKIEAVLGLMNKAADYDETDALQLTLIMDSVWKIVKGKRQEDELRKLSRAVEQSPVSIIITDIEGKIEYVNEFFSKITGYSLAEALGKTSRILKSGETDSESYRYLWDCVTNGITWNGEFHNRKKNGELYWEEASISPVTNLAGVVTHFIAVKEDITERKRITKELVKAKEEAEHVNKLKSIFLANMSHELRTPMNGILGFSEILLSALKDKEAIDMARTIHISGKRLLNTLNLILDLSRVEANKQEIKLQSIELNSFIRRLVRLFAAMAEQKGIALKFVANTPNVFLLTDPHLLEHVVNDLINNAIKFTDSGSVTVQVVVQLWDTTNCVRIKVIDTGFGIPKHQQDFIFDAFRQASEGYERTYEGTGLGLTISRGYLELLGGNILLNSEPGVGSEFCINFPAKYLRDSVDDEKDLDLPLTCNDPEYEKPVSILPRILLIDDDEFNYALTSKMLTGIASIEYSRSGEEGLQLIGNNLYAAILLDIHLGAGINGISVVQKIKGMQAYVNTPIVAVTAYSMVGDKEKFFAAGCTHYLSKPFSKRDLIKLIRNILP
ncbi:MAG: PAS domain S-box protein [Candidatus Cloacimonas sp.]|nr:PAS domain S-box protein [Candidatus Cloacimonas sp.]